MRWILGICVGICAIGSADPVVEEEVARWTFIEGGPIQKENILPKRGEGPVLLSRKVDGEHIFLQFPCTPVLEKEGDKIVRFLAREEGVCFSLTIQPLEEEWAPSGEGQMWEGRVYRYWLQAETEDLAAKEAFFSSFSLEK